MTVIMEVLFFNLVCSPDPEDLDHIMKNWAASPKKEISLPVNYVDSLST